MSRKADASGGEPDAACWAVVPAAGLGRRFGGEVPKQYQPLAGRTVIEWALAPLLDHPAIRGVVVALAEGDSYWPRLALSGNGRVSTVTGGHERIDSVANALDRIAADAAAEDRVLVHDAARPCLSYADLDRLIQVGAGDPDGAILATPVADTLKRDDGRGRVAATLDRDHVWRAMTPQLFPLLSLRDAIRRQAEGGAAVTDEAMAMERAGFKPRLVEGEPSNIKLTSQADLALAERLLAPRG